MCDEVDRLLSVPDTASSTLVVDDRLAATLTALIGGPAHQVVGTAWAALLFPTLVLPRLALPDDVWEVYRRVEWDGPVRPGPVELVACSTYVSALDDSVEVGLRTAARVEGGGSAESLSVLRLPGSSAGWGTRALPARPDVPATTRGTSIVFDRATIEGYLALADLHHPLVDSSISAQHRGLPNRLVPSGLLLVAALRRHPAAVGSVEMWFRAPVPEGAIVNVGELDEGGGASGLLTLPSGRTAAQYRYRGAP